MITRFTERDITLAGVRIPANCPVLLGIGAANRDPRQFEDPAQFSLDRGTINHITFGRGPHFCIGAHLVRFQGRMQRGPVSLWLEYDAIAAAMPAG